MRKVIDEATSYLCKDTLGLDLEFGKSLGKGFYGASIPVYKGKSEYYFYLFFKKDTLKLPFWIQEVLEKIQEFPMSKLLG